MRGLPSVIVERRGVAVRSAIDAALDSTEQAVRRRVGATPLPIRCHPRGIRLDTAPDNGSILEHFCRHVVDISLLVPDSSGSNDVEFFVLLPGSTHVHELRTVPLGWDGLSDQPVSCAFLRSGRDSINPVNAAGVVIACSSVSPLGVSVDPRPHGDSTRGSYTGGVRPLGQ